MYLLLILFMAGPTVVQGRAPPQAKGDEGKTRTHAQHDSVSGRRWLGWCSPHQPLCLVLGLCTPLVRAPVWGFPWTRPLTAGGPRLTTLIAH